MKSIIGFYSPPLTQVERDVIIPHLKADLDYKFTQLIKSKILHLTDLLRQDSSFLTLSSDEFIQVLNSRAIEEFKILFHQYDLTEFLPWSPVFKFDCVRRLCVDYPAPLDEMMYGTYVISSHPHEVLESEEWLCEKYNLHLIQNKSKRAFNPTPLALIVDEANTAIIDKINDADCNFVSDYKGCQDFSDIILDVINKVK